jgi:hypothetical protein
MKKKTTTFGLTPGKISDLLKICAEFSSNDADMDTKQKKIELLQDRLSETLLMGLSENNPLSEKLTQLCNISGITSGETIRNLLLNPGTDIELIRKIKEHGKNLFQNAKTEIERDTADSIYYATIAHALIYKDLRITKFSYEELEKALSFFAQAGWISKDLLDIFNTAIQYCHDHLNRNIEGGKCHG